MLSLSPWRNRAKSFPEVDISDCFSSGKKRMADGQKAARKGGVVHDVEKMQQTVPPITRETVFWSECLYVGSWIPRTLFESSHPNLLY